MINQFNNLGKLLLMLLGCLSFITGAPLFGQGKNMPYGLSHKEWNRLRQPAQDEIHQHPQTLVKNNAIIANGGFETGDFTGWTIQDLTASFIPLSVRQAGLDPGYGLFTSDPTEGSFAATHGFDGNGPGGIQIVQDISLPSGALSLEFDYRAGWDLATYCNGCTGSRIFMMNIRVGGGGAILRSDTLLVATPNSQRLDTGNLHGSIDVSALANSFIRISFKCIIPEAWTGPAFFQLDNVFVTQTGPQISPSPNPVNFANVELGRTKTLSAALRNIGTEDLTVTSLSDPGGVFSIESLPSLPVVIPPGASEMVEISFTPPDSGIFTANLTVDCNDPDDPNVNVALIGRGLSVGHNVGLLANVNDHADVGYSDCWGYTAPNGDEYALLGTTDGVSIVAVTDPAATAEVDYVPFVPTPPYGWYDIKTYQNYMYVSTEGSRSIQIVDLSSLPNPVSVIGTLSGLSSGPHNIFIDVEAALLYVVEDLHFNPSVRIFRLADPTNPVQVSTIGPANNGTDSHDVFARDSVLYIAEGTNPSIGIYDMSDPANPTILVRHNIPAAGYVHQVWVSEDNKYMVTTEETAGRTVKIWDIQDLNNISLVSEYLGESQLAHNAYINGNYIYISHYESGLKVLDFSDPTAVTEYGFYDTYFESDDPDFKGAWGVYPFSPTGKIFVSDIESGLYVLQLEGVVGIEDAKPGLPEQFSLRQNYPNPFNPTTTLSFQVPQSGEVRIDIYNMLGQKVRTLLNDRKEPGVYQSVWDGKNDRGEQVSSGVYLYRMVVSDVSTSSGKGFVRVRKMILLR